MFLNKKHFCSISNWHKLKLKFKPDVQFESFYSDMINNLKISESIPSDKLRSMIMDQGFEKTNEEISNLADLYNMKQIKNVFQSLK